jgi:hypothetical protein
MFALMSTHAEAAGLGSKLATAMYLSTIFSAATTKKMTTKLTSGYRPNPDRTSPLRGRKDQK